MAGRPAGAPTGDAGAASGLTAVATRHSAATTAAARCGRLRLG